MSQNKKRVVVTGLGAITPLGNNVTSTWDAVKHGKSGITKISRFDTSKHSVQIAGEVKGFKVEDYLSTKEARKIGLFIQYAIAATKEALTSAKLAGKFGEEGDAKAVAPHRVGVNVSAGMGGLPEIEYWDRELAAKEKKTTTPFFVPMIIPNMASGQISMLYNAQGPNTCIVTACASSTHAIGESARLIQRGDVDVMIAGGAEAVICELGIAGFASMRALSTRNDEPTKASRPYDNDRDGFVLAEGSAVLILEEYEHAKKRGVPILAEVVGYGLNADAFHMTSPAPEGRGARVCMELALKDANLSSDKIDYVNTHGTSTPTGDGLEAQAVAKLFESSKSKLHVSSTKSMTGHLLGAAGAIEAMFSVMVLQNSIIPPTINLDHLDEDSKATGLNFTAHKAVEKKCNYVLSNSFGFGGTNGTLIFGKI